MQQAERAVEMLGGGMGREVSGTSLLTVSIFSPMKEPSSSALSEDGRRVV